MLMHYKAHMDTYQMYTFDAIKLHVLLSYIYIEGVTKNSLKPLVFVLVLC